MPITSTTVTLQSAAAGTGPGTAVDVTGAGTAVFTVRGTFVGTVLFEGSTYGTVYVPLMTFNPSTDVRATTTTTTGLYRADVMGINFIRASVSAYTSGTITVDAVLQAGTPADPGTAVAGGGGGAGDASAANQTTEITRLTSIDGKIPASPATTAKQDTGNTSLASIDTKTPTLTKTVVTATITSGQTASASVDLGITSVCGLICPAAMTGTTLSIQGASTSGGTYTTLKDINATAATFTFAANQAYYIDPLITAGFQYIKITSTGAEGADRAVTLLTRPV